jgi:hypothetical protein
MAKGDFCPETRRRGAESGKDAVDLPTRHWTNKNGQNSTETKAI